MILIILVAIISFLIFLVSFRYKEKYKKAIIATLILIPITLILIKFGQFFLALFTVLLPIIFKFSRMFLGNLGLINIIAKYIRNNNIRKTKSKITNDEAYKILGLKKNASISEVKEKYKKMIKYNHPDRGGSEYISSLINEAKNKLVSK